MKPQPLAVAILQRLNRTLLNLTEDKPDDSVYIEHTVEVLGVVPTGHGKLSQASGKSGGQDKRDTT